MKDQLELFENKKLGNRYLCTNKHKKLSKQDFYQTPYSMTIQLFEHVDFYGHILEPSAGDCAIVDIIKKYTNDYSFFDIKYNDYDFLKESGTVENIITNPPYSYANEFILKSKEIYRSKIAMLLPLNYLHGLKRYELGIYKELKSIFVFIRYPMLSEKIRNDGKYHTGMMAYSWYIWEKGYFGKPEINWINNNKYVIKK